MTNQTSHNGSRGRRTGGGNGGGGNEKSSRGGGVGGATQRKPQEIIKTWAFDSIGPRKYALQIRKASNGNPCLKIVEGVPQGDGSFRRFELTFWSEDFQRLFATLDEVRAYMQANNIRTPDGHKYEPKPRRPQTRPAAATAPVAA